MIGYFSAKVACVKIERAHKEIGLIANTLFDKKGATTASERAALGRRLNGANVHLRTATMILDEATVGLVALSVWAVRYSGDAPRDEGDFTHSLWADEVEAYKCCEELNDGQPEVPWYIEKMPVKCEWRSAVDAEEAG